MRCAQSHNICYNFKSFTRTRPNLGTLHASHPSFAATASALPRANDVLIHDTDKNKLLQSPRGQAINYDFVVREQLSILRCCYTDNHAAIDPERHLLAVQAAVELKHLVSHVVDTKASGLKSLQSAIISSGAVTFLLKLAKSGEPSAFEALQMLCYRNAIACEQMVTEGVVDIIAADLSSANTALQNAMCYLLTGLVAFSFKTHTSVAASGLVPHLVGLCRNQSGLGCELDDDHRKLSGRAASVLRNLAHNTEQQTLLEQSGAIEALVGIMRSSQQDSASSINAAVAVACLVGHEEGSARLQLDKDLVGKILEVLNAACQGVMCYGMFWTVWKLCQGLTNLTVNDKNKMLVTAMGGIPVLSEVLLGRHHNNEAAQRYALSALWNLAFHEASRKEILQTPGLVDAIRSCLAMSESPKTKEVAKGALWTLGLEQDLKTLTEHNAPHLEAGTLHVMLSYEWSCQPSVLLIKSELEKAGYKIWVDIDNMSGSTLEAMAQAVEESAAVLICVSKKYKDSQACRTEAEYAFQQRKKIIPVVMESGFKPTGWLGALMGTRLYFDMSDARRIPAKMPHLMKELADSGKIFKATSSGDLDERVAEDVKPSSRMGSDNPDNWSSLEVEDWLKKIRCADFCDSFRSKDMDGMALCGLLRMSSDSRLMHEVLEREFGMEVLGQRLRLIEELHRLYA